MKWEKKQWKLFVCVVLMIILTACGTPKKLVETKLEESIIYEDTILQLDGFEGGAGDFAVNGSYAYIGMVSWLWEDTETSQKRNYYLMDLNDYTLTDISNPVMNGRRDWLFDVCPDVEGNLVSLILKNYALKGVEHPILLSKVMQNGTILEYQDVTGIITPVDFTDGDMSDIVRIFPVGEDTLVIAMETQVVVLSDNYQKVDYILLPDGLVQTAAKMKDGKIICGVELEENNYLQVCNWKKGKWGERLALDEWDFDELYNRCLLDGYDCDFYYRNEKGIYGVDWERGTYMETVSFEKAGMGKGSSMRDNMVPIGTHTFMGMEWMVNDEIRAEMHVYSAKEQ